MKKGGHLSSQQRGQEEVMLGLRVRMPHEFKDKQKITDWNRPSKGPVVGKIREHGAREPTCHTLLESQGEPSGSSHIMTVLFPNSIP